MGRNLIEPVLIPRVKGVLFIIGGHEDKERDADILTRFTEAAGGKDAKIAVITTASEVPDTVAPEYQSVFNKIGVKRFDHIRATSRAEANDDEIVGPCNDATGIMMSGGAQARLTAMLGGTLLCETMKQRYKEGAIIGGTSAGASAMGDTIILRSPSAVQPERETVRLGPGLGLVKDILIDQHFNQRNRIYDLLSALALNPAKLGIGLDEDTAIIVTPDGCAEVVGTGALTIADGRSIDYTDLPDVYAGDPISISGIVLHVLTPGHTFDLKNRTLMRTKRKRSQTQDNA